MKQFQKEQILRSLPKWGERNEEQKRIYEEISCIEMIESIFCYTPKEIWLDQINNKYLDSHREKLGDKRVNEIFIEQYKDMQDAVIYRNVYTDSEGVSYNSIEY